MTETKLKAGERFTARIDGKPANGIVLPGDDFAYIIVGNGGQKGFPAIIRPTPSDARPYYGGDGSIAFPVNHTMDAIKEVLNFLAKKK